jgi:hypothetical protein
MNQQFTRGVTREAYFVTPFEWAECELRLSPNNNRMGCCNTSAAGEERVCRLLLHQSHHKQSATLLSAVGGWLAEEVFRVQLQGSIQLQ